MSEETHQMAEGVRALLDALAGVHGLVEILGGRDPVRIMGWCPYCVRKLDAEGNCACP